MTDLREQRIDVNGIDTCVVSAGQGEPLVFLHGAGTLLGFDHMLPLAERFRLILPYHPGYGASADDPRIDSIYDYVLHYLDLLDALELEEFTLVGHSMGGYLSAKLASLHPHRIRKLVLAAPIGLRVPEHPVVDLFSIPDDQILGMVSEDPSVFEGKVPIPPTPEFLAERYRENTSTARVFWNRTYDLTLPRWLHRLTMPTLLLWGEKDRLVPVQQADVWAELVPGARIETFPGVGHALFAESADALSAVAEL